MTRLLLSIAMAVALVGPAFACDGATDGACCGGKKSATRNVAAADNELARQAAASMFETSDKPAGSLTTAQRERLDQDAATVRTVLESREAKHAQCDHDGKGCCEDAGKHGCCDKAKATDAADAATTPGEPLAQALDGAGRTIEGDKCGKHKL